MNIPDGTLMRFASDSRIGMVSRDPELLRLISRHHHVDGTITVVTKFSGGVLDRIRLEDFETYRTHTFQSENDVLRFWTPIEFPTAYDLTVEEGL